MTISQLITQLSGYENQAATVTVEIGNEDTSRDAKFELFSDTSAEGYITIFVEDK